MVAFVLAHFVEVWGASGISGAFQLAFWTWLGFIATVLLGPVLWEGKSVKLYLINALYYVVALSAMAVILTLWS